MHGTWETFRKSIGALFLIFDSRETNTNVTNLNINKQVMTSASFFSKYYFLNQKEDFYKIILC